MAYTKGNSKQIIIGAASLFVNTKGEFASNGTSDKALPNFASGVSYRETLDAASNLRNIGYTSNGLEIQFQPNFGEVNVDQILDVAKLYKQGMQVNLNTSFAEATLENLLIAIAGYSNDLNAGGTLANPVDVPSGSGTKFNSLDLKSGELGAVPVERGLVAVGPGSGDPSATGSNAIERVYVAYRALSIQNVTVNAKRDAASMFDVSFRLLPDDASGSYGKIIDRTVGTSV